MFRGPNGAAAGVAAQHSQCYAAWYGHCPGLKVREILLIINIVICTLRVKFLSGQHVRTRPHDLLIEPRLLDFKFSKLNISLGN